jgi:hypothetical protein
MSIGALSMALFAAGLVTLVVAAAKIIKAFATAPKYFPPGYQDPWAAETRYAFNYLVLGPAVPRAIQRGYIHGYYLACAAFGLVALGFWAMGQEIYAGLLAFVVFIFAASAWGLVRGYRELGPEG